MRIALQIVVICCTLLVFGAAKLHFEDQLSQDMVEQRLIQPPIKEITKRQLGQTGSAAALGGLRSPLASIWNLRAFLHFENLDWIRLEQAYDVITTLQPQTSHYWETGAWHLHTNASVHYKEDSTLSPFRRRALQRELINKGSDFLEEGIKQNPDNWKLHYALAKIWSDHYKLPDLDRSIRHYDDTLACESLPDFRRDMLERFRFYTMTRIPSRYEEALKEGRRLYHASDKNRTPSLINDIFALQNALKTSEAERIPDEDLYPSKKIQLKWLQSHWKRRNQDFPMSGVKAKIVELKEELQP